MNIQTMDHALYQITFTIQPKAALTRQSFPFAVPYFHFPISFEHDSS